MSVERYVTTFLFKIYKSLVRCFRWTGLGKRWPFESIHHALVAWLKPRSVSIGKHTLILDRKDSCKLSSSDAHVFELEFLRGRIRPGDVVLDIGANIGLYTLVFAECVQDSGHVFAFEPHPPSFALLERNIQLNGVGNVTLVPCAVSDETGTTDLYVSRTHNGIHRIHKSPLCREVIRVPSVRLDDYFAQYDRSIDLVKIDIEGEEYRALQGMKQILRSNPSIGLFLEYAPCWIQEAGFPLDQVPSLLREDGFELFHVNERAKHVEPVDLPRVTEAYPARTKEVTNFWCARSAYKIMQPGFVLGSTERPVRRAETTVSGQRDSPTDRTMRAVVENRPAQERPDGIGRK